MLRVAGVWAERRRAAIRGWPPEHQLAAIASRR